MARYNRVKINSTYLTGDGTAGGARCKVEIPDLLAMRIAPRNVEEDLEGGQHPQFGDFRGFEIPMTIASRESAHLDDLIAEINTVEEAGDSHNLVIEGDTGNFDLDCALVSLRNSGEFSNGRVKRISLVFKVDTMNEYAPEE